MSRSGVFNETFTFGACDDCWVCTSVCVCLGGFSPSATIENFNGFISKFQPSIWVVETCLRCWHSTFNHQLFSAPLYPSLTPPPFLFTVPRHFGILLKAWKFTQIDILGMCQKNILLLFLILTSFFTLSITLQDLLYILIEKIVFFFLFSL